MNICKTLVTLSLLALFLSCVSSQNDVQEIIMLNSDKDFVNSKYKNILNTLPENGKLTLFSAITRKAFREEEILYAKYDLAKQVSIYYNVLVDAQFAIKSNTQQSGTLEEIKISYDKSFMEDIIDNIVITNHIIDNEGSYFSAVYNNAKVDIPIDPMLFIDGEIGYSLPNLDGYYIGIGTVKRSRYIIGSLNKADEQAMAILAKQVNVEIKSKTGIIESESRRNGLLDLKYEKSIATLHNFMVLSRWISEDGNYYNTLAVCKKR